jgi:hypothetical protein
MGDHIVEEGVTGVKDDEGVGSENDLGSISWFIAR